MKIIITDHYSRTEKQAEYDAVVAVPIKLDHWAMFFKCNGQQFDEYFTADVFDLVREMVSPIC